MPDISNALNVGASPNYSIDQILQATNPPKKPGGFRQVLGGLIGGVGNIFAPGIGGLIGNAIGGMGGLGGLGGLGGGLAGGAMGEATQYLQLQRQMNQEQVMFETASAILKCRHDAAMACVHNIS